jgi:rare lipoprotein A
MNSAAVDPHRVRRASAVSAIGLCLAALAFEGALVGLAQARFDAPESAVAIASIRPATRVSTDTASPPAPVIAFRFDVKSDGPLMSTLGSLGGRAAVDEVVIAIPRLPLPPVSPRQPERVIATAPINPMIEEREAELAPTMIVGAASMYDPTNSADRDSGDAETASGEYYDPNGWTAAIQIDLRGQFNGVRYRMRYEPTYALVEAGGKSAIVRINDVGPLRPGRIIDLNARAMRFFDPRMRVGVLQAVRVTPLPGRNWFVGPVDDEDDVAPVAQASLAVD